MLPATAVKECMKHHQPDLLPVHVMGYEKATTASQTQSAAPQDTPEQEEEDADCSKTLFAKALTSVGRTLVL